VSECRTIVVVVTTSYNEKDRRYFEILFVVRVNYSVIDFVISAFGIGEMMFDGDEGLRK